MKRVWLCVLALVPAAMFWGCDKIPASGTGGLRVLAPDYLAGIVDSAGAQFFEENGISVTFMYADPDSIVHIARDNILIDLFLIPRRSIPDDLHRDTSWSFGKFSCPLTLSLVMAGRDGGPTAADIRELKEARFRRVVIVDPEGGYEGRLAREIMMKHRIWKDVQKRLIMARSADHLLSFLRTGEADAAIVLESSLGGEPGLVVMERFDDKVRDRMIHCGAVRKDSRRVESARAFLDLFDSPQCRLYTLPGVYRREDR